MFGRDARPTCTKRQRPDPGLAWKQQASYVGITVLPSSRAARKAHKGNRIRSKEHTYRLPGKSIESEITFYSLHKRGSCPGPLGRVDSLILSRLVAERAMLSTKTFSDFDAIVSSPLALLPQLKITGTDTRRQRAALGAVGQGSLAKPVIQDDCLHVGWPQCRPHTSCSSPPLARTTPILSLTLLAPRNTQFPTSYFWTRPFCVIVSLPAQSTVHGEFGSLGEASCVPLSPLPPLNRGSGA
jgi:hypothetical protein